MDAERSRFIGSRGNYAAALRVSAHDYRLFLQLQVKRLLPQKRRRHPSQYGKYSEP